jgi:hypothetical protein
MFSKLFLPKGTCQGCSRKGKGKCKIEIRCMTRRAIRKDKGTTRTTKAENKDAIS